MRSFTTKFRYGFQKDSDFFKMKILVIYFYDYF